jgi:hypothetical protein
MYKDKSKQKEANRKANQRLRDKKAGIEQKPDIAEIKTIQDEAGCVIPVIPDAVIPPKRDTGVILESHTLTNDYINSLTIEQIIAMPHSQAVQILEHWRAGKGNGYQARLGATAYFYREHYHKQFNGRSWAEPTQGQINA